MSAKWFSLIQFGRKRQGQSNSNSYTIRVEEGKEYTKAHKGIIYRDINERYSKVKNPLNVEFSSSASSFAFNRQHT